MKKLSILPDSWRQIKANCAVTLFEFGDSMFNIVGVKFLLPKIVVDLDSSIHGYNDDITDRIIMEFGTGIKLDSCSYFKSISVRVLGFGVSAWKQNGY